jgi:hypothetical protein
MKNYVVIGKCGFSTDGQTATEWCMDTEQWYTDSAAALQQAEGGSHHSAHMRNRGSSYRLGRAFPKEVYELFRNKNPEELKYHRGWEYDLFHSGEHLRGAG